MAKPRKVILKKSNVLLNGQPKLPDTNAMQYGELAVNYAVSGETLSIKNSDNQIVTFSSDAKILGQIPSVADYFDGAEYDSNSKRINFKHENTVKAYIDATDFIKDGMVSSVTVSNGNLVISFNTEAGREDITLALTQIFNPNNYYDKATADGTFLTGFTETDPTVPDWAKASTKPTYTANEVGALSTGTTLDGIADGTTRKLSNYSLTSHTHSEYATTSHTHTAAEVGAMATSERSNYSTTGHTHDQYATTSHTHTAAEVGAMATSERSNYLATGTTLDGVADGSTRKLSNYLPKSGGDMNTSAEIRIYEDGMDDSSAMDGHGFYAYAHGVGTVFYGGEFIGRGHGITTGYTRDYTYMLPASSGTIAIASQIPSKVSDINNDSGFITSAYTGFSTTAHTHTAEEVGAMATSERSNYATTAHTHTAAEVGAMATSERGNYLTTATTIPTESTITGSGFTKNAITGINVNGSAATVTNGVAEITVQGGGSTLPSVTAADNGKVLMVVNGAWAAVMPTTVYTGTDTPLSSIGNDGDIYLQTS